MGSIHIGYRSTMLGSLLGLIYGLCDGFIGGYLLAAIYYCLEGTEKKKK